MIVQVKCLLKVGHWELSVAAPGQPLSPAVHSKVFNSYRRVTELEPKSYKGWHSWAMVNFQVVEQWLNGTSSSSSSGSSTSGSTSAAGVSGSGNSSGSSGGIGAMAGLPVMRQHSALQQHLVSAADGESFLVSECSRNIIRILSEYIRILCCVTVTVSVS
jgi:FAT domain